MTFNHPVVFAFLCGAVIFLSLEWLRPVRRQVFLAFTVAYTVLLYAYHANPGWLVFLGASIALHYLALRLMLRFRSPSGRMAVYYGWFLAAIAAFLIVKEYTWLTAIFLPGSGRLLQKANLALSRGNPSLPVVTIGLSFLIFRQVHMAIEVRDGVLKQFHFLDYISYLLAFWTFTAGPIQRYEPFCDEFRKLADTRGGASAQAVLLGLNRVMFGYLKMFVVGNWFYDLAKVETFTRHSDLGHLAIFLLAYPVYMYLNFTGYCDIVVGIAKAVGFTLPENFNRPFLARNMIDYWNRWHITLSAFFRDYMYLPIYMSLRKRTPQPLAMSAASMLSFFVMGIWHDNTVMMAVFGLFHGAGIVAVNLYEMLLKRWLTREQVKRYRQSRLAHVCAVALCQAYVVTAFLFFAYDWHQLSEVQRCLGRLFR